MRYRTCQGERLSEIGVGTYALSGAYGEKDPAQFIDLLRRAYDLGVTFFDTADVYGPAEEVLGRAVAPFRDQVWIATKVGANLDGGPDCSHEHVVSSCERSLQRLQTDYLDLYQIHRGDPNTPIEETVTALEELKAAGKIRRYGLAHLPLPQLQAYLAAGRIFSELVELSAVSRKTRKQILPLCREHGAGVIAFSTTGRGLLTGKIGLDHVFEEGDIRRVDPLFQRERFASGLRVVERLEALGEKYGRTPVQVAVSWVLAQPGVVCALVGPSTIPHLEEDVGGSGWTIAREDLEELERFFEREDERTRQEQVRGLRTILEEKLDPDSGFADLIYVFEVLVEEVGLAAEEEILPLFQSLWALRGRRDASALKRMQAIQGELRDEFSPALAAVEEEV
ncbi:MAG: aldo/keto reductase [Anaerolineae bacterium]|jgi:aryl-alcohol dehydrogenase-like predicted oxidoreductase